MAAAKNVLVVGGGFSGMAAAIQMRKAGLRVDLVEIDPQWRPLGAGITVNGPTLRALLQIGVYEEFKRRGAVTDGLDIYDGSGHQVAVINSPPPAGADVAGGGGILRPELARILADATLAAGVNVRLGCTFSAIAQSETKVSVTFTDGSQGDYDLLVGADGINSQLRSRYFPEVDLPAYTGQSIWRAVLPRPAELVRPAMWLGDRIKIGVNPVSSTQMYMFINEQRAIKTHIDERTWPELFVGLMQRITAPFITNLLAHARKESANIDYRPISNLLVPPPWNRGRIVLIGDTVAATTPHLASGAAIGIESGLVLAEEIAKTDSLSDALNNFHNRRWERCRMVVKNSERLCMIEINGGSKEEHGRLMNESTELLRAAI